MIDKYIEQRIAEVYLQTIEERQTRPAHGGGPAISDEGRELWRTLCAIMAEHGLGGADLVRIARKYRT
jgi:hypothetical protein